MFSPGNHLWRNAMKTRTAVAVVLGLTFGVAGIGAVLAGDAVPGQFLSPAQIIQKLTQDGIQLRELEWEDGIYEARVQATDGSIVKVGIDPQTAELTDAYSHSRARTSYGSAPKVNAAEAIQAVAATGRWNVREVELERDGWHVKATDDNGRKKRFVVDAVTGAVK
jgi:uncharacterized membrane protein YkoI